VKDVPPIKAVESIDPHLSACHFAEPFRAGDLEETR
jgi:hypothetical protein